MGELKQSEIYWVMNTYIGVAEGYLGDFTYRTHREFYPGFCDLDINPDDLEGTTRERFLKILSSADGRMQAAILRGVAKKYPVDSAVSRTAVATKQLKALTLRCNKTAAVDATDLRLTSELLERVLADAKLLLVSSGPSSAIDRVHTALHAYIKAACETESIPVPADAPMTSLFKALRQKHTRLRNSDPHQDTVGKALLGLASVIDAMNPARNRGSLAHPNKQLLGDADAILFINLARTTLQYLDAKLL